MGQVEQIVASDMDATTDIHSSCDTGAEYNSGEEPCSVLTKSVADGVCETLNAENKDYPCGAGIFIAENATMTDSVTVNAAAAAAGRRLAEEMARSIVLGGGFASRRSLQ